MQPPARHAPCRPVAVADLAHVLEHTAELWSAMRGERLFITGGTGFFGVWLLESFAFANEQLGLNAKAVVLSRDPSGFAERFPHIASRTDCQLHRGDVRGFEFPDGAFRFVLHGATTAAFAIDPLENFSVIVDGARRVLDFAVSAGAQRFLMTSSGAVYGRQPAEMSHIPEDYTGGPDPLAAGATYAESKRAAELLCALYQQRYGLEAVIARCFAFVGPHLPVDQHFAIGNFVRDRLAGNEIRVQGDGTAVRSYLYAADLAAWLWTLLFRGRAGRAYNVGSDEAVSIGDLAAKFGSVTVAQPRSDKPPAQYVPDVSRARAELDLHAWIGLDEAIRRTLAWHRA